MIQSHPIPTVAELSRAGMHSSPPQNVNYPGQTALTTRHGTEIIAGQSDD